MPHSSRIFFESVGFAGTNDFIYARKLALKEINYGRVTLGFAADDSTPDQRKAVWPRSGPDNSPDKIANEWDGPVVL